MFFFPIGRLCLRVFHVHQSQHEYTTLSLFFSLSLLYPPFFLFFSSVYSCSSSSHCSFSYLILFSFSTSFSFFFISLRLFEKRDSKLANISIFCFLPACYEKKGSVCNFNRSDPVSILIRVLYRVGSDPHSWSCSL